MRSRPWWIWLASASFVGYWLLLTSASCYLREPAGYTATLAGTGILVQSVARGSAAERAGMRAGDRLVSAFGLPQEDRLDQLIALAAMPVGVPTEWVIERGGVRHTLTVRPLFRRWNMAAVSGPYLLVLLGMAMSLALGLLVAWRGDRRPVTLLGAWLLASMGCATLPIWPRSMAAEFAALPLPLGLLLWPATISSVLPPVQMFAYCALVPRPLLKPRTLAVALVPVAAVASYVAALSIPIVYAPAAATSWPVPPWLFYAGPLGYVVYLAASAILLVIGRRRAQDPTDRRRVTILLAGTIAGAIGLLLVAGTFVPELNSPVGLVAGAVLFTTLPAAFAYATLRHRLFDLRLILRQGLQYALARGAIGAVVPVILLVLAADVALHRSETLESIVYERGFAYVTVLVIVYAAYSRRLEWMAALDRRFFRDRYAAQQILTAVVQDVGASSDFDTAAAKVVGRIDAALHPVMAAVMARTAGATVFSQVASSGAAMAPLPSAGPLPQIARAVGKPVSPGSLGVAEDVDLVVPIAVEADRDEALLVLGPRKSEEPYSHEDKELLAAIAASLRLLMGRTDLAQAPTLIATPARAPQLLAGRYRIERPIGEGGMGVVYAASDTTLQRKVAIKVIKNHLSGEALARFQREARTAASLSHPHIVTVHDYGTDDTGSPFLVMELLEGQPLRAAINAGPVPLSRALAIISGLASAIDAAHRKGVIHRDLKPENVFLVSDTHAKILDYGIAKAVAATTTFATAGIVGTLAYMAPEQAAGGEAAPAWDIWALSIILFELLTARHPFHGGLPVGRAIPVKTLAPALSDALAATIDRALSLSPEQRPASAQALLRAL